MSYRALLEELQQENLCTWFVLPLLFLNKVSFISSNFVNSYLSTDLKYILVRIIDEEFLSQKVLKANPHFKGIWYQEEKIYLVYRIPENWEHTVNFFKQGRFSEFGDIAKSRIYTFSGLEYKKEVNGKIVTDGRLMALERHAALKEMWNTEIAPLEEIDGELMSIPPESAYIEFGGLQ